MCRLQHAVFALLERPVAIFLRVPLRIILNHVLTRAVARNVGGQAGSEKMPPSNVCQTKARAAGR